MTRRVLFIENHDSFSWNVIDALPFAREELRIVRPDEAELDGVELVVMGPGPTDPHRAGLVELVQRIAARRLPFLGVCLGHQALGLAFGAELERSVPAHGKRARARVVHDGVLGPRGAELEVMRYHSLSLADVRAPLRVLATLEDGTVMAVAHESLPMAGVQFHPDSFGTPDGRALLAKMLSAAPRPVRALSVPSVAAAAPVSAEPWSPPAEGAFALLAPGFADGVHWTLLDELTPSPTGELWFASAESKAPRRFTGRRRAVTPRLTAEPPRVALDERGYLDGVRAIRERIAAGDVYQVNLTLRARVEARDGGSLLAQLCRRAVPRFAAWVRTPELELVSASPELLVEVRDRWIHAEPMKGTSAPGERAALERSEKDRAELAMITDLLRDDLHRLCEPGSVQVTNERRFVELPYVVQAVSDVEGVLRPGVGLADVLGVVHPGGSVTGAPREAALAVIDELEATPRGAYCGTLGFEHGGLARFALLIRTAQRRGEAWTYGVGSGITWDSVPEAELDEVRLKLGALSAR